MSSLSQEVSVNATATESTPLSSQLDDSNFDEKYSVKDLPGRTYFIILMELCERFSYYGLRAILVKYMVDDLHYGDNTAKAIFSYASALAYSMPIIGGVVSDSYLGKFMTILLFSIVYVAGSSTLALTAIDPSRWGMFLALFLISIGTGGIKPCVSSFGADQLQTNSPHAISTYFHIFYFAINVGSVCSILTIPIIRSHFSYAVAFSIPAVLLVVAILIFLIGKPWYNMVPASGSVLVLISKVMCSACREKKRVTQSGEDVYLQITSDYKQQPTDVVVSSSDSDTPVSTDDKAHWLDYAKLDTRFTVENVEDTKKVWNIVPIFCVLPMFFVLFDQQGSTWVLQADKMNRHIGSYEVLSEQVQALNAVFVLICVPLFDGVIYPFFHRRGYKCEHLSRMIIGMFVTALAFGLAAMIDHFIETQGVGKVNIALQIPQYVVISIAEVLVSVTGLEFAYARAPTTMKSTVTALFLLTSAVGDTLAGILFTGIDISNFYFSIMCCGLMIVNIVVFYFIAQWFHRNSSDVESTHSEAISGSTVDDSPLLKHGALSSDE